MIRLRHLISHRFRGFAPYENTLAGLTAALDFGVLLLEFDIRVARCGTPMIYHDEYAYDASGKPHYLCDLMARDFAALGGDFGRMPTAETVFAHAANHANQKARLLIDIKDAGFEVEINALVHLFGLEKRCVYVSWLPEVLYALHDLAADIPLCLSHWSQKPDAKIRANHKVFAAKNREIARSDIPASVHGLRSGWYIDGPLQGQLRRIIKASRGAICVPRDMISRALSDNYHADNIAVSTFAYTDWDHLNDHKDRFNIDLYFIDKKDVFEEL